MVLLNNVVHLDIAVAASIAQEGTDTFEVTPMDTDSDSSSVGKIIRTVTQI